MSETFLYLKLKRGPGYRAGSIQSRKALIKKGKKNPAGVCQVVTGSRLSETTTNGLGHLHIATTVSHLKEPTSSYLAQCPAPINFLSKHASS